MARCKFFVNAIVEFEEWLTASIIRVGEVWKLFCGLQNKLQKALLFINGPNVKIKFKFCKDQMLCCFKSDRAKDYIPCQMSKWNEHLAMTW